MQGRRSLFKRVGDDFVRKFNQKFNETEAARRKTAIKVNVV